MVQILLVIGVLLVLDSLFAFLFPNLARKFTGIKLKKRTLYIIASFELVIGVILILFNYI